jgi:hypothetical protein
MTRRKHRLYIDVTYSSKLPPREAAKGLQLFLDSHLDLAKCPVWTYYDSLYIEKLQIVENNQQ